MAKKPGPRPMPADVVELHGNRSKLSKAELEERRASTPQPRPLAPKPPSDLSPVARGVWTHHAAELEHLGLLTVLDGLSFRLACECAALALAGLASMRPTKKDGTPDARRKGYEVVIPDPAHGGFRRHPGFLIWRQAQADYRAWCGEFGLTPLSRVGLRPAAPVGTVPDDAEDDDAFFGT